MHQPELIQKTQKIHWIFEIQMDHLIHNYITQARQDFISINKKKQTCYLVDFAVPVNYRVKIKESNKIDKYLTPAKELKKLWKIKVIIIGALEMVSQDL